MTAYEQQVVKAAIEWRKARQAMIITKINTPECKTALNRLSEAEDSLSIAVWALPKEPIHA